jgi:hypothetical protein
VYHVSCIVYHVSCVVCRVSCVVCRVACDLCVCLPRGPTQQKLCVFSLPSLSVCDLSSLHPPYILPTSSLYRVSCVVCRVSCVVCRVTSLCALLPLLAPPCATNNHHAPFGEGEGIGLARVVRWIGEHTERRCGVHRVMCGVCRVSCVLSFFVPVSPPLTHPSPTDVRRFQARAHRRSPQDEYSRNQLRAGSTRRLQEVGRPADNQFVQRWSGSSPRCQAPQPSCI